MTLCSRQNCSLGGKKKQLFCYLDLSSLFIWFIHTFTLVTAQGNSEKGCTATGNDYSRRFLCLHPLGPLLLLQWKNLKEFFFNQGRKQKSLSLWMSWGHFSKGINERQYKGSFGPKGRFGMSSNLLRSFCFVFIYFLSILLVTIWKRSSFLATFLLLVSLCSFYIGRKF